MPVATEGLLPRWDMSPIFPSLSSPQYQAAFAESRSQLERLEADFDSLEQTGAVDEAISRYNPLLADLTILRAYVSAHTTTDSRDEAALAAASQLDPMISRAGKLSKRLVAWLGREAPDDLLGKSQEARNHEFYVRRAGTAARHQMSPELESLASDLDITGPVAWHRLHSNLTSQLTIEWGAQEKLPMSAARALASDSDRTIRRAAYEAELKSWKTLDVPLAAALNCIKGETLATSERRGWESPLDATLFGANIDRKTLEAMLSAARKSFPQFRRYLKLKAKALGLEKLAWFDLFAPVPGFSRRWEYGEATAFIVDQFSRFSDRLGGLAKRAVAERWIDAEPRSGKVDGAYCSFLRNDESRVLLNFKPSFDSVSTFAHELGHAYHNLCLCGRTPIQRSMPMTLAETASIFCETIVRKAVQKHGSDAERGEAVQGALQGATQTVVDIYSRYLFETWVFARRKERELSPREFCELMLETQRETYGEGLDWELLHPYMWAVKSHYYGRSYYNFPYMFGLLFGLGLNAVYEREGEGFESRYDALLSSTGMADAAALAAQFDIDLRSEDFWAGSLAQIEADVDLFERLIH